MSNNVLIKWEQPKEQRIAASKVMLKFGLDAAPRMFIIAAIIMFLFYLVAALYIERFIPGYIKQTIKILITSGLFIFGLIAYALFMPVLFARLKCTYSITEKGISKSSIEGGWFIPWKAIAGYAIIKDDQHNFIALKATQKRVLNYAPELEEQLDLLLSTKLTKLEPEAFSHKNLMPNIESWQWLFILGLVIIWVIVGGYWVAPVMKWLHQSWPEWALVILFLSGFFIGPVTIGFFLLFGWRTFKSKGGFMPLLPILNMISWILTGVSGVIWEFERIFRQLGK
jgi:hypothetical protein